METGILIPSISNKDLRKIARAIEFGGVERGLIPFLKKVKERGYSLFSGEIDFSRNDNLSDKCKNPFISIEAIMPYLGDLRWLGRAILIGQQGWGEEKEYAAPEGKYLFIHRAVWQLDATEIRKLGVLGIDIRHGDLGKELTDNIKRAYNELLDTRQIDIQKKIIEYRNSFGLKWHYGIDIMVETEKKNTKFKSGKLVLMSLHNCHDGQYSDIPNSGWTKEPTVPINPSIRFEEDRLRIVFDNHYEKQLKKTKRRNLESDIEWWKKAEETLPEQIGYSIEVFDKIIYEKQAKNF